MLMPHISRAKQGEREDGRGVVPVRVSHLQQRTRCFHHACSWPKCWRSWRRVLKESGSLRLGCSPMLTKWVSQWAPAAPGAGHQTVEMVSHYQNYRNYNSSLKSRNVSLVSHVTPVVNACYILNMWYSAEIISTCMTEIRWNKKGAWEQ